jgi:hypothetical protein
MSGSFWRRDRQRLLHLLVVTALGVFVYSPLRTNPTAVLVVQAVAFPVATLSGLLMWKGGRLRAWLRERSTPAGS